MQLFTSQITHAKSIRQVQRELQIAYPLTHKSITPLIHTHNYLYLNENNLVQLNYKDNFELLAYSEYLRKKTLYEQTHTKELQAFIQEIINTFDDTYFIILLFGSAVEKTQPNDYDILFIFENNKTANQRERAIDVTARQYSSTFDTYSLGTESIREMATKRSEKNLLNEVLNKHIILYGAENFYRLLAHVRQ